MQISFPDFFSGVISNPLLLFTVLLTLAVVFVNGWTDAPNAIASCVATRCLSPRASVLMAAFFNFAGVIVVTSLNAKVAQTVFNMVNFSGGKTALTGLSAAMCAVVVYSAVGWVFGIPTSESHSLIAGLTGSALALNGIAGVNFSAWVNVLYGLVLSVTSGFLSGFLMTKAVMKAFRNVEREKCDRFFKKAQIGGSAAMAFMHGAQDGQKFISVFLLIFFLSESSGNTGGAFSAAIPFWLMLLCSSAIALGTSIGGYRIIKAVGMDMVKMQKYQGFSADFSAAACLLLSSLLGLPVSTTHTKTTAVIGAGAAKNLKSVKWNKVTGIAAAWLVTFPGCGLIGFFLTKMFLVI